MKVGWLHLTDEIIGGAEVTNSLLLKGKPKEVEIVKVCPDDSELPDCDKYILHNINPFSPYLIRSLFSREYVFYPHDIFDAYHPLASFVVNHSRRNIYLSPAQSQIYHDKEKGICIPPPLEVNKYQPEEGEGVVYLGRYIEGYGIDNVASWADKHEIQVDFYGWGDYTPVGAYVKDYGRIPQEEVPNTLARYNKFIFLPELLRTFSRSTAEAKLSGCKLICNENVGALSYGWNTIDKWRENLLQSKRRFWEVVLE